MARLTAKTPKTGDQITAAWIAGMQSPTAQQKYKNGINNFNGNPMALAASPAAMDKYVRNVQASVASGKRARALNNADPGVWKTNALNIGAPGLGTGAQKAKSKMLNRMNFMAPVYNQASQAAAAIPDDGNMNLQKVAAAIQVMRSAVGKG